MRELDVSALRDAVARLCVEANLRLPGGARTLLENSSRKEESPLCRDVLCDLVRNLDSAERLGVPICQDTGMAVVFLEIGQDVHFTGGALYSAVNAGVAAGYEAGRLRMSVVADPLDRVNTGDNTPAIIHPTIVPGENVRVIVAPKGFGSENMSAVKMFTPSAGEEEIVGFVRDTVSRAGSNPCPPVVVGVGIGGDFEYAALLAKKALCRAHDERNANPLYARLEAEMLAEANKLGIGAQGFGGRITALYVNIEQYPTHIAGLPVAVNMGCHVTRHAEIIL